MNSSNVLQDQTTKENKVKDTIEMFYRLYYIDDSPMNIRQQVMLTKMYDVDRLTVV